MIDPDVNNADVSKDIRMIRLDHFFYGGVKS
jgi:hypothetical protein